MNPGIILLLILITYCVIGWFVGTISYVFAEDNNTYDDSLAIAFLWPFYLLFLLASITIIPITVCWIEFLKSLKNK